MIVIDSKGRTLDLDLLRLAQRVAWSHGKRATVIRGQPEQIQVLLQELKERTGVEAFEFSITSEYRITTSYGRLTLEPSWGEEGEAELVNEDETVAKLIHLGRP